MPHFSHHHNQHHFNDPHPHHEPPVFPRDMERHFREMNDFMDFSRGPSHMLPFPVIPGNFGSSSMVYQSESVNFPRDSRWTQESRVTSTVNGVTQSIWKRRDSDVRILSRIPPTPIPPCPHPKKGYCIYVKLTGSTSFFLHRAMSTSHARTLTGGNSTLLTVSSRTHPELMRIVTSLLVLDRIIRGSTTDTGPHLLISLTLRLRTRPGALRTALALVST
jgi:hypothetical protein